MHWIVDAMNVVGSRPDGWWRDRAGALAALVEQLQRWAVQGGHQVTVVLERPMPLESELVTVVCAPRAAPNSADDEIVRLVRSAHGAYRWKVGDTVALGAIKGLIDRRGAMKARQMLEILVAAGSAPLTVHEIKAVEMLFTDVDYVDQLEPLDGGGGGDLTAAILALGDQATKDAKIFSAAQCVPLWKALGVVWFRKTKKRRKVA